MKLRCSESRSWSRVHDLTGLTPTPTPTPQSTIIVAGSVAVAVNSRGFADLGFLEHGGDRKPCHALRAPELDYEGFERPIWELPDVY